MKNSLSRTLLAFLFALLPAVVLPAVWPFVRLTFFAPFLVILCYQRPRSNCLWFAAICGTFMDLLSSQQHLGLYALNYCLTLWMIYPQKRNFFEDRLSTLPVMTYLFSFLSTLIHLLLLDSFEKSLDLSWIWVGTDLLLMPLADAFYAFIWFTLPSLFMPRAAKREYFVS